MNAAPDAMLEQGNRLRARELIPFLAELARNATPIEVEDITGLTADQLDALQPGNVVVKKTGDERHVYTVDFKDGVAGKLLLTYADWQNVEGVYYEKVEGVYYERGESGWAYVQTDNTHIAAE